MGWNRGRALASLLGVVSLCLVLLPPQASAAYNLTSGANTVSTSKFEINFENNTQAGGIGYAEWIRELQWRNSANVLGGDLMLESGLTGPPCNGPNESSGMAYGGPGFLPLLVAGGNLGRWQDRGARTAVITGANPPICTGDSVPVRTRYSFFDAGAEANVIRMERRFSFTPSFPSYSGSTGLRSWVPRFTANQVIYPNPAGTALNSAAPNCGGGCEVNDWNGTWFAVNYGDDSGFVVLRDPANTTTTNSMFFDNDSSSASNQAAVYLPRPAGGWTAPITETQYICFYDATSWPTGSRSPTSLPPGCAVRELPISTARPTISPNKHAIAQAGDVFTATPGTWDLSTGSFTYQWQRCNADGTGCADIPGQNSLSYTAVAADVGKSLRIRESAANANGETDAEESSLGSSPVDDTATVAEDSAANNLDVTANDTDPEGDGDQIVAVSDPANGTATIVQGSPDFQTTPDKINYVPDADYCNSGPPANDEDTFTYTADGGKTGTVRVTVTCSSTPPVANDDTATVGEDSGATNLTVLSNDTDVENDPIEITGVTDPAHGTTAVVQGSPDRISYTPDPNYCNDPGAAPDDTFTYTVNGNDTATVSVTVTCVNDNPAANDDARTVNEDAGATSFNVLTNDTDADGDPIEISAVTDPPNGTATVVQGSPGNDQISYTPDAEYCNDPGTAPDDTFGYTVNGGDTAQVSVVVTCVDDAPRAVDDAATVDEDAAATPIPVLSNDTDPDGGTISIASSTDPAGGDVAITGGGSGLTYKPDPNFCGADSFRYTINGGASANVGVMVTCVDEPPAPDPSVACKQATPTISGTKKKDKITGTEGDDVIFAGAGNDKVQGLGGNDIICLEAGNDKASGGDGNDSIHGYGGRDKISGDAGDDKLLGSGAPDKVIGGEGNDVLNGGPGADKCAGGSGSDQAKRGCDKTSSVP